MGASGSTRKIVVEDQDGGGVVKISESVVRRIKGQSDREESSTDSKQQTHESRPSKPTIIERPVYYPAPTIKDNSRATQEIEAFYQEKLKQLEERNAQLQKITTEQFAKAVKEVEQKFIKQTGTPVCESIQDKVYNCYHSNPKESLNCWQEVGAFTTCVERARQNALARRG
ncbi:hypothetical protein SNE40_013822 [Patella caerulea]|uniref:Coiled-coil-helix-coiled-coil-helix domain-containing protein 3, mitochondrial n=1 Tax=Patella caerulea TaxID=87958 RepID=A0AAN8PR72_PATCE